MHPQSVLVPLCHSRAEEVAALAPLLSRLPLLPGNLDCFQCGGPHPKWVELQLGVLVCLHCAGSLRGLGVHLAFMRSLFLDSISLEQYLAVALSGNQKVRLTAAAAGAAPKVEAPGTNPSFYSSPFAERLKEQLRHDVQLCLRLYGAIGSGDAGTLSELIMTVPVHLCPFLLHLSIAADSPKALSDAIAAGAPLDGLYQNMTPIAFAEARQRSELLPVLYAAVAATSGTPSLHPEPAFAVAPLSVAPTEDTVSNCSMGGIGSDSDSECDSTEELRRLLLREQEEEELLAAHLPKSASTSLSPDTGVSYSASHSTAEERDAEEEEETISMEELRQLLLEEQRLEERSLPSTRGNGPPSSRSAVVAPAAGGVGSASNMGPERPSRFARLKAAALAGKATLLSNFHTLKEKYSSSPSTGSARTSSSSSSHCIPSTPPPNLFGHSPATDGPIVMDGGGSAPSTTGTSEDIVADGEDKEEASGSLEELRQLLLEEERLEREARVTSSSGL